MYTTKQNLLKTVLFKHYVCWLHNLCVCWFLLLIIKNFYAQTLLVIRLKKNNWRWWISGVGME